MSWLDNILGESSDNSGNNQDDNNNNNSLNDKDIALDMLAASKFRIEALAKTITETTNPQLRQMLTGQLNMDINEHFRLSDIAVNNQWYNVQATPQEQVKQDVKDAESLSQSQQQQQQQEG